jgi:hypothetical protein
MVRIVSLLSSIALVSAQDLFLQRIESALDVRGPVHSCVNACLEEDHSKHFSDCEADGSTDCSTTKCCQVVTDTCYVKNPYWSSCQPSCEKGHVDETGEKWDCTPLSPTGCIHLQACIDGCHSGLGASATLLNDSEPEEDLELSEEPVAENLRVTGACTGGSKDVCYQSCKQSFDDDYMEHVCEVLCDKNCPDEPTKDCPNKNGLIACLSSCKETSKTTDSGSHCEKDGSTSCLDSKCCQAPGAKCFTKNPYWAACTGECTPGKVNPLDGQIWDCEELKGKQVCDSYKYRTCATDCARYC